MNTDSAPLPAPRPAAGLAGRYDVVILGAGLAGLTLSRHLLLDTDETVLLLDRQEEPPGWRQKYGESTVQLAGHYYGKVLDLSDVLHRDHTIKYNLRFYWPTPGRENRDFEDYGQCFIRQFSNVVSYQLDRNTFEAELLRLNRLSPRFTFQGGVSDVVMELREVGDEGPHRVSVVVAGERREIAADWVVDASGRNRHLARRKDLARRSPIRHGAYFFWVDGLLDVEKLTAKSRKEVRLRADRSTLGHIPFWLATNHFCGEGYWFWVIPLQGKTSLGLVFDSEIVDRSEVDTLEKLIPWVCERHPCLAHELPHREVLYWAGLRDYAHGCSQTISAARWAMTGEAGRFLDPLYSPGSDFIALHNTLIVDAIQARPERLADKCRLAEQIMRACYESYVPGYTAYATLGDQETFTLKYVWELAIYFGFLVFPFVNDLFTDPRFGVGYLARYSRLGPLNLGVQDVLLGYYRWKKERGVAGGQPGPTHFDFLSVYALAQAEKTFYEVGVDATRAKRVLEQQLDNLEEMARWIAAHVASVVLGDERVLDDRAFVAGLDPAKLAFAPEEWARLWREEGGRGGEPWPWRFCPRVASSLRPRLPAGVPQAAEEAPAAAAGR
ncbi:MAG TPA: tryptophan 7-halogenase [Thermoanaerobaculia bacterium]|nr:tryptophan 7-halogenase [Thermoanaerobaculia bacterium]